jgi:hypothetical protein
MSPKFGVHHADGDPAIRRSGDPAIAAQALAGSG